MCRAAHFAVFVGLCCLAASVWAFKEHDFKKCADSNFCVRSRHREAQEYWIDPSTVRISRSSVSAKLYTANTTAALDFTLQGYGDTLRLYVNEDLSHKRFEVPDVVVPSFQQKQQDFSTAAKQDGNGITLSLNHVDVYLQIKPFALEITQQQKPLIRLNGRQQFFVEQHRRKQEGDPEGWWEETFKSHKDSKPKGPTAVSFDVEFVGMQHVYGIPERAGSLSLKSTRGEGIESEPYRLYNLDVFEYLPDSPFGLYGSIPFMLAHNRDRTLGAFWLNAAEMYIDVEHTHGGVQTRWTAESGVVDLYLFTGPQPQDVVRQYGDLTGGTAMPQLFALGYHQCRWNYRDEADVEHVDSMFDTHAIPYDVLWLDIEHTDGKRYFTWDKKVFPNPVQMQNDVASRGRKMVTIIDPHVKRDSGWDLHNEATKKGFYVKSTDGKDFEGWCWPGSSSYLDMLNPMVRSWWATRFALNKYEGSTQHLYTWNDMNEPSVFNGPEITMHKDLLHIGGVEHRDVHNAYGFYYHMASAAGLVDRGLKLFGSDGDRPFVLSRAFFAGTQRVGPVWTGDNEASWPHLRVSLPMVLGMAVAGLPFAGADVGGFFGNPSTELLIRWYQAGVYYPFFRGHAHLESKRREPWLFGDEATNIIRDAIRERYALLPYTYTLFRAANVSGMPIARPMWFEFPCDEDMFAVDSQMMFGPALLVAPVLDEAATTVQVALPKEAVWYNADNGARVDGGTHVIAVTLRDVVRYYRGGHIVPRRDRARRSTAAMAHDPLTLIVALNSTGGAEGELYMDDGRSFAFTRGIYLHRRFVFDNLELRSLPYDNDARPGKIGTDIEIERIVVLGLPQPDAGYTAAVKGSDSPIPLTRGLVNNMVACSDSQALVIRKPGLRVADDWSIVIKRTGVSAV